MQAQTGIARFARRWRSAAALALTLLPAMFASGQTSPTAFTYQGRIALNGAAYTGSADVQFQVFDASESGSAVAAPITVTNLQSQNGLFTVSLDFGVPIAAFPERWIELTITTPSGGPNTQTLAPRQPVRAAPASSIAFAVPVYSGGPITPFKGMVRFNDTIADFQGFNGFFWTSLTGKPNAPYSSATYGTSDTFTVPAGVTKLFVEAWGGGGGGGGTVNVSPSCGVAGATAGITGGSGGYAASAIDVTPGEQLQIVVGARGDRGFDTINLLTSGFDGTAGGTTQVLQAGNVILLATGGQGGSGATWEPWGTDCANQPGDQIARPSGAGGTASGGNIANITGAAADARSARATFCLGCCLSGFPKNTPAATPSSLGQLGLPGAITTGAGGAGRGSWGPSSGPPSCPALQTSDNGQRGEVRVYWTTAP